MKARLRVMLVAVTLVQLLVFAPPATAAPAPAISISPAFQELELLIGQDRRPVELTVTNPFDTPLEFSASVVDFGTMNETGGVAFLGTNAGTVGRKYALSPWIKLERPTVTVAPKGSGTIKGTVENLPSLAPGGHYGAIVMSPVVRSGTRQRNVQLRQSISSLLLVKKLGGERYDLQLDAVRPAGAWFSLPKTAELRFQNTGNVHAVPRGLLRIIDPQGRIVAKTAINPESALILPDSARRYGLGVEQIASTKLPGPYKFIVQYREGSSDKVSTRVQTVNVYWTDAMNGALVGLVSLVLVVLLLRRSRRPATA